MKLISELVILFWISEYFSSIVLQLFFRVSISTCRFLWISSIDWIFPRMDNDILILLNCNGKLHKILVNKKLGNYLLGYTTPFIICRKPIVNYETCTYMIRSTSTCIVNSACKYSNNYIQCTFLHMTAFEICIVQFPVNTFFLFMRHEHIYKRHINLFWVYALLWEQIKCSKLQNQFDMNP